MIRIFFELIERYGLDVAQIGLIIGLFYKLATNHLKHIQIKIEENSEKIDKISNKVDDINIVFGERIATIEGRIGAEGSKDKE